MPATRYDRKKVRRAMVLAPAAALLGVIPFLFNLNLSLMQFLTVCLALLVIAYLGGLLVGGTGYLILRAIGFVATPYLIAYAVLVVVALAVLSRDVYALVSFGPPILLAASVFCYLRGPAVDPA